MLNEFKLGKLRFNFCGDWDSSVTYEINDVVKYGASSYVYNYGIPMAGENPFTSAKWSVVAKGVQYRGTWVALTLYLPGDIVTQGTSSYVALTAVASATGPSADALNWQVSMAGSSQSVARAGDTMTGPLGLGGDLDGAGNDYKNLNPKVQTISATATVDITKGPVVVLKNPTADTVVTFSGMPAPGHVAYWELEVIGRGTNALTIGNAVDWERQELPDIMTGTKRTVLAFRARNDGGTVKIMGALSFGDIA